METVERVGERHGRGAGGEGTESSVGHRVGPLAGIGGKKADASDWESGIFPEGLGSGKESHCSYAAFIVYGVGDGGRGGVRQ